MPINQTFISELQEESKSTKRMLECIPNEKLLWKPHDKSMTLSRLASHIAELIGWIPSILNYDELDLGKINFKAPEIKNNSDILKIFTDNLDKALQSLNRATDEDFMKNWTLRKNETIYFTLPKIVCIRTFCLNHIYHHRGQLTVYFRLLNIPVPSSYGPTADEIGT